MRQGEEANIRLLDMLLAWAESYHYDEDGNSEIHDLYQEAGALNDSDIANIEAFLLKRLVPFILTGKKD